MRILISGASGFIGAPLVSYLRAHGHEVVPLVRGNQNLPGTVEWDPEKGWAVKAHFEGFDAVIHLAGEPLTLSRWTEKKKEKILFSRSAHTWILSQILASLLHPPKVFISASAIGYYGDRGDELLHEMSPSAARGFLPAVCREWEKASLGIENRGTRTVRTRFGMVIGPRGGAVKRLLLPYKLGLGAVLGDGKQWISWISRDDLIRAMEHLLHAEIEGAVNFVSPHPVRQKEFSAILARLLHRPAFLRIPGFALRLLFGTAADEMLLASARVSADKLIQSGFSFKYPDLISALRQAID